MRRDAKEVMRELWISLVNFGVIEADVFWHYLRCISLRGDRRGQKIECTSHLVHSYIRSYSFPQSLTILPLSTLPGSVPYRHPIIDREGDTRKKVESVALLVCDDALM
jgi:hypothetical protein